MKLLQQKFATYSLQNLAALLILLYGKRVSLKKGGWL
jgi:hypothetical protein